MLWTIVPRVSTKSIFPASKLVSECYIEFRLMAKRVELTRARVNMLVISANMI